MSEEAVQAANATEEIRRMVGALGIGDPAERHAVDDRHLDYCLTLCRHARYPGKMRKILCGDCHKIARSVWLEEGVIARPEPRWSWRFGYFLGGWAAAFEDAGRHITPRPARTGIEQALADMTIEDCKAAYERALAETEGT